jgi:hypothetical protein
MTHRTFLNRACAFLATFLLVTAAQAIAPPGLFRAYLSSTGSDTNDCTRPTPCRLLPAALAAVADGGEIWMLDSANYNTATVNITKSVSILAVPGAVGSVVATGGPAISITAGSLTVALRNLVIVPLAGGGGTSGVEMTGASTLFIENSLIANLPTDGVKVVGAGKVKITNCILRNNGGYGVWIQDGALGEISGTQILANANGILAQGTGNGTPGNVTMATISDSIISGGSVGVSASALSTGLAQLSVTRSTIEGTVFPVFSSVTGAQGGSAITISGNTITNNSYPWVQSGAGSFMTSLGNNHIRDNANPPIGLLATVALQ